MNKMFKQTMIGLAVMGSLLLAAAQQPTGPKAQPSLIPPNKAHNPGPPPEARAKGEQSSIGKRQLAVATSQPVTYWQEQLAIGGSLHAVVTTEFLYDPNLGVVYAYREDDFACSNGQTAHGGILEAIYTAGNKAGKPPDTGWYAVELDAGKCGAKESGIYGCKIDANDNPTECGAATINNRTGEIELVAVQ